MHWLPNAVSTLRALAAFPVVLLVAADPALALVAFCGAAATDALDGWLARRLGAASPLGAFLDPLADKILVLGTLAGLLGTAAVGALPVGVILVRELAVTALRTFAAARGRIVAPSRYGKAKAVLQGAAVAGALAAVAWPAAGLAPGAEALLWAAAALTVASGVEVAQRASAALAGSAVRAHAP